MSMATHLANRPAFWPPIPDTIEKLGISDILVQDLVLRRVMIERTSTLASLSKSLKLSMPGCVESKRSPSRIRNSPIFTLRT